MKRRLDIRKINKKVDEWLPLFKYEEDYLRAHLRDEADTLMSIFVKFRDKDSKWIITCITCWERVFWSDGKHCNNAHFITREHYQYRRDPKNCHWACSYCNAFDKQVHQQNYTIWMIKEYGMEEIETMIANSKKPYKDPSIEDIREIIRWLTDHIYQLKQAKENTVILSTKLKT